MANGEWHMGKKTSEIID